MVEPKVGLQIYQSIKQVRAGEITEVVEAGCYVLEADGTKVLREFEPGMTARYMPKAGDFWVIYAGDDYQSISPRAAFLAGYVPVG